VASDSVVLNTTGDLELLFLQKVEFHQLSIIAIPPHTAIRKQHCGVCKALKH